MKKITLFIFSLIVSLVILCGLSVKADPATLAMVDGAQVRTAAPAGLRFQATASNLAETDEHGFYLALGTHTLSDMRTAIEAGASTVGGNKLVKKSTTGEEPTFAVTVYDIPEAYYTAGITAVAYLKTGEDYTLNIAVTRNIAEVALNQFKTVAPAEFLKDIVDTCYYAVNFSTTLKYYIAAGSIYENNVDKIKDEFLADWKAYDDSVDTSTLINAFSSSNKTKIRNFALDDNTGARKWHWLWGYLSSYNQYKKEIVDLWNDAAEPTSDSGYTILYQVYNFFANGSWKVDVAHEGSANDREIHFWEHPEYYSQIDVYNNTLEADHTDAGTEYVLKGGTYTLPDYDNVLKDYYDVTGWNDGSSTQASGTSYTLSAAKTFKPIYTATTYTVTYMDGEENISASFDASKKSFTVESAVITLPATYEKDGYAFDGWYTNAGLTGDPVTTLNPASTHENKIFYAKMTAGSSVTITFDDGSGVPTVKAKIIGDTITEIPVKGAYIFEGWYDGAGGTGTKVTEVPDTDATLYAKWTAMTKGTIIAKFLADVNAAAEENATEDTFYDTFSENIITVLKKSSLAKYQWLIEYIESKNVASDGKGNKRIKAAMNDLGYAYTYTGSSSVPASPDAYAFRMMANDIHNFLKGANATEHGGDYASYPPADFSAASAYDDLLTAAATANFSYANLG